MEGILAVVEDEVLKVTLDRAEKRNALSRAMLENIGVVFRSHADNPNLVAALLRGAGDECFAAGGDLRDLAEVRTLEGAVTMAELGRSAFEAIRQFPVPVIAALNGSALGGGAELAMCCDYRVAAGHAQLGFLQRHLNISTAWGGGMDLMQLAGTRRGLRILARGEVISAEDALAEGLVDLVASDGQTLADAAEIILGDFRNVKPQVLRAFKAVAAGLKSGLSSGAVADLETQAFAKAWIHEDHWQAADKYLKSLGS